MSSINVQKKLPAKEAGLARPFEPFLDWEPMRRMRQLFAWDPFAEMALKLESAIDPKLGATKLFAEASVTFTK